MIFNRIVFFLAAKLKEIIRKIKPQQEVKYKIGNIKKHNTHVDTLIPQYVEIGDNFISAPGSYILAHDASTFLFCGKYRVEKTTLGNNVFLGAGSIVLPGVIVGDNVIIGAGSVVTKSFGSNVVVAGNPAKVVSTVDDYIAKTKEKGCLFEPPSEFFKIFEGKPVGHNDVVRFQYRMISDD